MPAIRHTFVAGGDMIDRFDFVNAIALWAIGYRQQAMLCAVCLRGVQFLGVHWRMRTAATCCCSSAKNCARNHARWRREMLLYYFD